MLIGITIEQIFTNSEYLQNSAFTSDSGKSGIREVSFYVYAKD